MRHSECPTGARTHRFLLLALIIPLVLSLSMVWLSPSTSGVARAEEPPAEESIAPPEAAPPAEPTGTATPEPVAPPAIEPAVGPTSEPAVDPAVEPAAEPTGAPSPTTADGVWYDVQAGDTLDSIALQFGTTPEIVAGANNLDIALALQPAQRLWIPLPPGSTPVPTPMPPTETPTATTEPTATMAAPATPTLTPTNEPTQTATITPTDTMTPTVTASPSVAATSTITGTPALTLTLSITGTPSITGTLTPTGTPSITGTLTLTTTPTITETVAPELTATPVVTETVCNPDAAILALWVAGAYDEPLVDDQVAPAADGSGQVRVWVVTESSSHKLIYGTVSDPLGHHLSGLTFNVASAETQSPGASSAAGPSPLLEGEAPVSLAEALSTGAAIAHVATLGLDPFSPAGDFTIETWSAEPTDCHGPHVQSQFTLMSVLTLELDFSRLVFGAMQPGQPVYLSGDGTLDFEQGAPTLRNAGNAPAFVSLQFDAMVHEAGLVSVEAFGARFLGEELLLRAGDTVVFSQPLHVGAIAALDLWLIPPQQAPVGRYSGALRIGAQAAP